MELNVPNFIFYGVDHDWFEEMFLFLLHIEAMFDGDKVVHPIP
jgi:hypothetical protein